MPPNDATDLAGRAESKAREDIPKPPPVPVA
jgi:hypothetical protein